MNEPRAVSMTLAAIRDVLDCDVLTGGDLPDIEVTDIVASDGMSAVLSALCRRALLLTGLANIQSVRTAHVADLAGIVYVRGVRPSDKTIEFARQKKLVLLATTLGMFDCCGILRDRGLRGSI